MNLVFLLTTLALADDDWGDDDDDAGFGSSEPVSEPIEAKEPWVEVAGTLKSDEHIWIERLDGEPWAKARQTIDLALSRKFGDLRLKAAGHGEIDLVYYIPETDDSDPGTFEDYSHQLRSDEVYAAMALGDFDVSFGRQVVAWGEGFVLSPVDVVNPRDLREPGLADLDDIRIPVTMVRLQGFFGDHRAEVLVIPEAHFGFRPTPSGPFGIAPTLLSRVDDDTIAPYLAKKTYRFEDRQERWDLNNTQVYGRWSRKASGLDLALMGGWLLDRQGNIGLPAFPADITKLFAWLVEPEMVLELDHQRYTMVAHSGARPQGDFLIRWELLGELGRHYDTGDLAAADTTNPPEITPVQANTGTAMVSIGYSGLSDTTIDLEVSKATFLDGRPEDLLYPVDVAQSALRISHNLMRERLNLEATGVFFGEDLRYGFLARGAGTYEIRDGVKAKLGVIHYTPPNDGEVSMLLGFADHDRVFGQMRWDF